MWREWIAEMPQGAAVFATGLGVASGRQNYWGGALFMLLADMELRRSDILNAVRRTDTGNGVVILTDMFGGTPSNLAISVMNEAKVEVIASVNLPMLVKLASVRNRPIAEAVRMAQEAGRKYITVASRILAKEAS